MLLYFVVFSLQALNILYTNIYHANVCMYCSRDYFKSNGTAIQEKGAGTTVTYAKASLLTWNIRQPMKNGKKM